MDEVSSSQRWLEEASSRLCNQLLNAAPSCFPSSQDSLLFLFCAALAVFCSIHSDTFVMDVLFFFSFVPVQVISGFGRACSHECPFQMSCFSPQSVEVEHF